MDIGHPQAVPSSGPLEKNATRFVINYFYGIAVVPETHNQDYWLCSLNVLLEFIPPIWPDAHLQFVLAELAQEGKRQLRWADR